MTNSIPVRRALALGAVLFTAGASAVGAQMLTLTEANAATLRGGSYASTNYGSDAVLETRASDDPSYSRRTLLKFDTNTTLAQGTPIASAG